MKWRGRLSWHAYSHPRTGETLPVLVDGAHNPASAQTLRSYIASLFAHPSSTSSKRKIQLTYILALSHSPPKTPREVLEPLLRPSALAPGFWDSPSLDVELSVAAVPFTKVTDMPWVKYVEPKKLVDVVREIHGASDAEGPVPDIWVPPSDELSLKEGEKNVYLEEALKWAASKGKAREEGVEGVRVKDEDEERLVVVAGSLYLVADFYRLVEDVPRGESNVS